MLYHGAGVHLVSPHGNSPWPQLSRSILRRLHHLRPCSPLYMPHHHLLISPLHQSTTAAPLPTPTVSLAHTHGANLPGAVLPGCITSTLRHLPPSSGCATSPPFIQPPLALRAASHDGMTPAFGLPGCPVQDLPMMTPAASFATPCKLTTIHVISCLLHPLKLTGHPSSLHPRPSEAGPPGPPSCLPVYPSTPRFITCASPPHAQPLSNHITGPVKVGAAAAANPSPPC